MFPPLSRSDLATLINEANAAARRLHRKLALPTADLDDLRQDLLVDLICRLPGFDAQRGSLGAFANIILRNQASRIALRHHQQRRAQNGMLLSLDVPLSGSREPIGQTLTEADGLASWYGQECTTEEDLEVGLALSRALARLPEADRRLCAALAHRSVAALATQGFGSRSALYRRITDLRHVLTAYGLGPLWDDFAKA